MHQPFTPGPAVQLPTDADFSTCAPTDAGFAAYFLGKAGSSETAAAYVGALEAAVGIICAHVGDSVIDDAERDRLVSGLDAAAEPGLHLLADSYDLDHLTDGLVATRNLLACWMTPLDRRGAATLRETLRAHVPATLLLGDLKALRRDDQSRLPRGIARRPRPLSDDGVVVSFPGSTRPRPDVRPGAEE